ncbi:hypothetical protein [Nostoc sp. TCL26-01]|uniref:hypothetical protein n=1 Tax=Nostoc sp. TCL26-01 TaxID=2576904 RepID=UPI0015BEC131|nr:hypothetical protein [Nostoc sp. TCL26-01]QLE59141.1 hypothetical protein FD725_28775 [Nostoc sp. TCL26-01]
MSEQKKVLFFSLYSIPPAWLFHHQVDATLATVLRMLDCDVLTIGCNGLFKSCYIMRGAGDMEKELCNYCSRTSREYFHDLFELPHKQIRDFVIGDDYNLAQTWVETLEPEKYAEAYYQDLPIGEWVTSSIYTYFRITSRGLSNPDVRKVHRDYLIDGLITYKAVSRLIDFYQPTHLFLLGARLAPSRIAFEVARQRNLDVIVQERGYINDTYTLVHNYTCSHSKPALNLISAWENIPLTTSELIAVKKYWLEREAGQNLNFSSFYDYQTDYSSVRRQLNIPEDAKIFAVFTSSEDELAMSEDFAGITSQLDIIDKLIEIFADRDEYLVLRHHPYIAGEKYVAAEMDFIVRAYQQSLSLPKNVRIIMPSEQLTSYALLWHTDAAIAFFSTMAIECTAKGIPTAVSEQSLYSSAVRHVIHQSDIPSLITLVDSLLSESAQVTIEDYRKLYRFTNTLFFRFCNKFSSFNSQGLLYENKEQLKPGIDPTLDKVCNNILNGSSLYNLPNIEHEQRSVNEENEFLEKYSLEICDFRQKIRYESSLKDQITPTYPSVGVVKLNYKNELEPPDFLFKSLKHSTYQKINEYSIDFDLTNHSQSLESILDLLTKIPDEYILLSHSNIQYCKSVISSAMEVLLADITYKVPGVWFGGWLPISENLMRNGEYLPQSIFTKRDPNVSYEKAVNTLSWLKYPLSLLAFCLIRKQALVKAIDILRYIPKSEEAAELLFIFIKGIDVHKIEKPLLLIQDIPASIQSLLRQEQLIALQENFNLKDINLIIFPDWRQSEDLITSDLEKVIKAIATHPNNDKITLLINTNNVAAEDAELLLSGVAMNLLMAEDLDISEGLQISLVGNLSDIEWQALLAQIHARIILDYEDKQALAQVPVKNLSSYQVDHLINNLNPTLYVEIV